LALTAAATVLVCIPVPKFANASSGNIHFSGNVTSDNACVITLIQNGAMVVDPTSTQMSSKVAGGVAGIAEISSLRNYWISVSSPTFFQSSPSGGSDGVTFTTTFSGQNIYRGRTFSERPGSNAVRLRNGFSITRVNVHVVANRLDAFPSGDYTAVTIVRCE
jgi:type 1 fimbria pilin